LRRGKFRVFDAIPKNQSAGKRFDALDLGGNEECRFTWREWRGDFDERIQRILLQAVKASAAFRNVFALHDFVRVGWVANARAETHCDTNVLPFVYALSVRI
jgi:hypothetical protein